MMSLLLLSSCDFYDGRLTIINKTNSEISALTFYDSIPDYNQINRTAYYLEDKIKEGAEGKVIISGKNSWPHFFEKSRNNKLNIFIISQDSLRKVGNIQKLLEDRNYKLYMFSKEEIESINWQVVIK